MEAVRSAAGHAFRSTLPLHHHAPEVQMTEIARDVAHLPHGGSTIGSLGAPRRVSTLAEELRGSMILAIAAEVRAKAASGAALCNLTVGDFSPSEFAIPASLRDGIVAALQRGETNYPPSDGLPALRAAIREFSSRRLGLPHRESQIVVTSGARPGIYAAYRALVDPGDRVVYTTPSWNNDSYCKLVGARDVAIPVGEETDFQPTAAILAGALRDARMLVLNSPSNPCGTLLAPDVLAGICDAVLEENAQRERAGRRPLYVLYDQVYWMLTFGGAVHVTPVGLRPEMERYTIFVDAISKSFAATGLRVGWTLGPEDVIRKMCDITTHVGAWAPKPEQSATSHLLRDDVGMAEYHANMLNEVQARLDALAEGIATLRGEGHPVESTAPRGAIYLSARFALAGRRTPSGQTLRTNEDIRKYLLDAAGLAMVQFQAFAAREESGWFRLSVGAVSRREIEELLPRIRSALAPLRE